MDVGQAIIRTRDESGGQFLFARPGNDYRKDSEKKNCIMTFGGIADPGETPQQAMVRELREEISYAPSFTAHFTAILRSDPEMINATRDIILNEIAAEYDERINRAHENGNDQIVTIVEAERDTKLEHLSNRLDALNTTEQYRNLASALQLQQQFETLLERIEISLHMQDIPHIHTEHFVPDDVQTARGWFQVDTHYYDVVLTDDEYALCLAVLDNKNALGMDFEIAGYADIPAEDVKSMVQGSDTTFKFNGALNALHKLLFPDQPLPSSSTQFAVAGRSLHL